MIKHQKQYLGDTLNVGYHAIRGHKNVYMILEENYWSRVPNSLTKTVILRMFAQVQRIHRPMPYAKGCTKQLVTS